MIDSEPLCVLDHVEWARKLARHVARSMHVPLRSPDIEDLEQFAILRLKKMDCVETQ